MLMYANLLLILNTNYFADPQTFGNITAGSTSALLFENTPQAHRAETRPQYREKRHHKVDTTARYHPHLTRRSPAYSYPESH